MTLRQLILPECLKLLPLYSSCITRSILFRQGAKVEICWISHNGSGGDINVDDRVFYFRLLEQLPTKAVLAFFYPRVLPVHDVLDGMRVSTRCSPAYCFVDESGLPNAIRPAYDRLKENGAYLIEDGFNGFLWIGRNASSQWLMQVLGASFHTIDTHQTRLATLSNGLSARVRGIIESVSAERDQELKVGFVTWLLPLLTLLRRLACDCEAEGCKRASLYAVHGRGQGLYKLSAFYML